MGVLQTPFNIPATIGYRPSIKFMVTTDNLATVTTAGYLNSANTDSATPVSNSDVILMLYGYNTNISTGTFGIFTVSISASTGITLTEWSNGGAVLPSTVGNFAVFSNTTGSVTSAPGNATQLGNIAAGASGTAGTVSSFPATASKGSLILKAAANTGNTTTTISNAAMGQATVVSIPDPGAATADFVVAPSALVSSNLVQASGTAGLVVDSGITAASVSGAVTQLGQLYQTSVTLTTAEVIAAYATPQVLIPAVAGKVAIVHSANVYTASTGNTPFATGTAPVIQYGSTVHGAGTAATGAGLVTGDIEAAASQVRTLGPTASTAWTGITDTAVTFSCATAYTAGTGTSVTFTLVYELITATI